MRELTKMIFAGEEHYLTSPYGKRTMNGKTSFHCGADYGTRGKKLPQYAVFDGTVLSRGEDKNYGGAKYVWVSYPSAGVKMLHYHLDSYCVEPDEKVKRGTKIGNTGMTGLATGIHLHLEIRSADGKTRYDPEQWSKEHCGQVKKYLPGNYAVSCDRLYVRTGPGAGYPAVPYKKLTKNARLQNARLGGTGFSGYVKGVEFTVYEIKGEWGRSPSGWTCLKYCVRL